MPLKHHKYLHTLGKVQRIINGMKINKINNYEGSCKPRKGYGTHRRNCLLK
jgi:hypothetical protein